MCTINVLAPYLVIKGISIIIPMVLETGQVITQETEPETEPEITREMGPAMVPAVTTELEITQEMGPVITLEMVPQVMVHQCVDQREIYPLIGKSDGLTPWRKI